MKRAKIEISHEALCLLLGLPDSTVITGFEHDLKHARTIVHYTNDEVEETFEMMESKAEHPPIFVQDLEYDSDNQAWWLKHDDPDE